MFFKRKFPCPTCSYYKKMLEKYKTPRIIKSEEEYDSLERLLSLGLMRLSLDIKFENGVAGLTEDGKRYLRQSKINTFFSRCSFG